MASNTGKHLKQEPEKSKSNILKYIWTGIKIILAVGIAGAAIAVAVYGGYNYLKQLDTGKAYVAGSTPEVPVYLPPEGIAEQGNVAESLMTEAGTIVRGTKVERYEQTFEEGGEIYCRITAESGILLDPPPENASEEGGEPAQEAAQETAPEAEQDWVYIRESDLVKSYQETVRETEVYVRTPATIYEETTGPAIASFAPKGTCLRITGFDYLKANGSVNKYKVEYKEGDSTGEGYVSLKYLVSDQESADAVYNEHGEYDKAVKDVYSFDLRAGKAADLDYYPFDKPAIEGNEFCRNARTMYINAYAATHPKPYVSLIKESGCNAVVIDIKDGSLAYESPVAKEYAPRAYKGALSSMKEFRANVDAYRKTGAYLIGRIVVFNDPVYAKDHPEDCIKYKKSTNWPSAYSRNVWEYNVRLAREAVQEFGFNEIQFDYVRFPETAYEMSKGKADFKNTYDETKGQAIQNFCFYAADQLREVGAYISVDVFGEAAYGYMTAYGQYWPGISNIVDAISAMPYTDHFSEENAWEKPYKSVLKWAKKAADKQTRIQNPAAARTWITGYDTPYWNPTVDYDTAKLKAQINALNKAGLEGGFIPWNGASNIKKYRQYKKIWNE